MEGMQSANGLPGCRSFHRLPVSPFPFLPISPSPGSDPEHMEGGNHHQRCSSDSFLLEEEPAWLDDLLDEPDTHFHKGHRRSASDSDAYSGAAAEIFNIRQESKNLHSFDRAPGAKPNSMVAVEHSRDEASSQNLDGFANIDHGHGAQARPCGSKTDINRAKKNNAHRSRVRKLQYMANLERTAHILKVEGSGISAELEFVEQQNIILSMENRALRQRLESISQEQMIKQWEQGMLEREITRLQTLYHLQQQQQMHLQQQLQQHHQAHGYQNKQGRNKFNSHTLKNKDANPANPAKASVIAAIRA